MSRQNQLSKIVIKGFKSIKECEIELGNINVLIGANGAGKSNFISVFEMLQAVLSDELQYYATKKGISTLFYNGIKITDKIFIGFSFGEDEEKINYYLDIEMTENNSLTFMQGTSTPPEAIGWRKYHFHDTGATSKMKLEHNISNCKNLHWDASNLAAFLYRLREHHPASYRKILFTIRLVAPYFKDFDLEPMEHNKELITLRWLQKNCDGIFNVSQLSDGTLRFICLAVLLLQPTELKPNTIIIDEPEIGLHPYAITILAELVKKAAFAKQVILSTQSAELINHFEAEHIVVVDRDENGSKFKRLEYASLESWLEDYSLGELWNKNVFGGRFSR